jgi:hypothetical protein
MPCVCLIMQNAFSSSLRFLKSLNLSLYRSFSVDTETGTLPTWATPPALFALVIWEIRSCFLPRQSWTIILLFKLPSIAVMTVTHYHPQHFSIEWGFCWSWTTILLISASQVDRTIGRSHWYLARALKNKTDSAFLKSPSTKCPQRHNATFSCDTL